MLSRWFVPRSTYDALKDERDRLEVRNNELFAGYQGLHDRTMTILAEATKKPEPPKMPERTRDAVIDAILLKAGTNGHIRTMLSQYAMQERRAGRLNDDEIIERVTNWHTDEDDPRGN